jgi:hypothetical protein
MRKIAKAGLRICRLQTTHYSTAARNIPNTAILNGSSGIPHLAATGTYESKSTDKKMDEEKRKGGEGR